jgi:Protein of unknown function (DUF736)
MRRNFATVSYLSVRLDSPFLAAPINAVLVEQDEGTHALLWSQIAVRPNSLPREPLGRPRNAGGFCSGFAHASLTSRTMLR